MRRPVRDEHVADPEGTTWQVLEVGKWRTDTRPPTDEELSKGRPKRPIPCGPYNIAYFLMGNADGQQIKVNPMMIKDWTPATDHNGQQIGDPLNGHRSEIAKAVKAGKGVFYMDGDSFVLKGDRYHLPCGEIVVSKVTTKTTKRGETRTEIHFTHLVEDKVYFLRSTVPAAKPDELVKPPTAGDIEEARINGNYLTGAPEKGGDRLPTVPPTWKDSGRAEREQKRLEALREERAVQNMRRQSRQIKAKLDEVNRMGEKGVDLTHELDDIIERLNGAMKDAA
jgi:hypothetical protein